MYVLPVRVLHEIMVTNVHRKDWFQNRRAKEKQMKKTRELEAQQDAERAASGLDSERPKEQDGGPVAEYYGASHHSQALQASSTAFLRDITPNQPLDIFIPEQIESGLSCNFDISSEDALFLAQDEHPSHKSSPSQAAGLGDPRFRLWANNFLPLQLHN